MKKTQKSTFQPSPTASTKRTLVLWFFGLCVSAFLGACQAEKEDPLVAAAKAALADVEVKGCEFDAAKYEPLTGGLTNLVMKITCQDEGKYVLRAPGEGTEGLGLNLENEYFVTQVASDLGIGPKVHYKNLADQVMLTGFIQGTNPEPEWLKSEENLEQLASVIRTLHNSETKFLRTFNPVAHIDNYIAMTAEHGQEVSEEHQNALEVLERIRANADELKSSEVPCHNDLHGMNVMVSTTGSSGSKIYLIDWDYAGNGNPYFDLGNLGGNLGLSDEMSTILLQAYLQREPTEEEWSQYEGMRILSRLWNIFWCYSQIGVSEIEMDFAGEAARYYDQFARDLAAVKYNRWLVE